MPDLDEVTYGAFREELAKVARLHGALGGAGAGLGLGALAGGAINAYRGYSKAREEGHGVGDSMIEAAKGAPLGALAGAAGGAALGAAGGAALPGLGASLAKAPVIGAPVRLAQRQVHGFTGWTPHEGLESIGGGAVAARAAHEAAKGAVGRTERGVQAAEAAQAAGLTSIPGYIRGLMTDPKGTVQKGFAEQWHNSGPAGKAITFGVPAIEAAHAAVSEDDPNGPGKAERIGRGLLPAAAGAVTGGLPFAAQLAVGAGLGAVGAGAGRVIDKVRGRGQAAVPPPYQFDDGPPGEARVGPGMWHGGGAGGMS